MLVLHNPVHPGAVGIVRVPWFIGQGLDALDRHFFRIPVRVFAHNKLAMKRQKPTSGFNSIDPVSYGIRRS